MTDTKQLKRALIGGALPLACMATPAHAGGLLSLVTKPLATATGPVTTTTAQVTGGAVGTVTSVVPLPTSTQTTVNTLNNTVASAPGAVTTTLDATGTIAENTVASGPGYLVGGDVFSVPKGAGIEPKWGKIRSFWGKIRSFEGEEVSPFWGKIRSFWGDVGPYEGDTAAFWGGLQTYNADNPSLATPQWGKIRGFWGTAGASWAALRPAWDAGDYTSAAAQLRGIVDSSAQVWGGAVQARTQKDFYAGFANRLLARYGIVLNDPASLAHLDVNEREHFFLEWHDGLMQFSGADQADYWMRMVNWSPSLSQTLGSGKDTTIGLLDFAVGDGSSATVKELRGSSAVANGHGDAVASLIAAPHDGIGIMGIAPQARVLAYNPFDATETAGWSDIKSGIVQLGANNVSIVNMSLGVPGWTLHPDWNAVLADPSVALLTKRTVFVIAAGNDGITQTQDIAWRNSAGFLVVGSVDPAYEVSEFSNRPGETCLQTSTGCDKLKNHFIVAPGEMMLVSDGAGSVTRYSGTSFAAPLVSGTIALIHDRWPWLSQYPNETASIILKTARDLGAPGVDPVYGVGMLDVTRALSPIDFNKLTWYKMDDQSRLRPITSATMRSGGSTSLATWEAAGAYFTAFETVGGSYRDFLVPLSSKLTSSQTVTSGTSKEQMQAYLYNQAIGWMKTGVSLTDRASLNYAASSAALPGRGQLQVTMSLAPRTLKPAGLRQGLSPYQSSLRLADSENRFALKLGEGDGAIELGGNAGFTHAADYDPARGGANPLLGMASGGAFGQFTYALGGKVSLAAGFTEQNTRYDRAGMSPHEIVGLAGLDGYRSAASIVSVSYRPAAALELTGAYTRLREQDAILGVQALDRSLMGRGATSEGVTLGASYQATPTLQLAASATLARTRSGRDTLIGTSGEGFRTSAFQVTLAKQQVLGRSDALRLSLAQPLHVEQGALEVTSVEVIDRATGDLGEVTRRFALPGSKRPLVGELQYGSALMDGQAEFSLFGKAQLQGEPAANQRATVMAGAKLRIRY